VPASPRRVLGEGEIVFTTVVLKLVDVLLIVELRDLEIFLFSGEVHEELIDFILGDASSRLVGEHALGAGIIVYEFHWVRALMGQFVGEEI